MKLPYSGQIDRAAGTFRLYYITDRRQFAGGPRDQQRRLLAKIAECVAAGIDYIQLREKDLTPRALEDLALQAGSLVPRESKTRLLINSRIDVALACAAHGVHLPAHDLPAGEARVIFHRAGQHHPVIAVSTHSVAEVSLAEGQGADFAVLGPVFEKDQQAVHDGLENLAAACRRPAKAGNYMPVLALGGITVENARQCIEAGANGIAAIRLFQENNVADVARKLRAGSIPSVAREPYDNE